MIVIKIKHYYKRKLNLSIKRSQELSCKLRYTIFNTVENPKNLMIVTVGSEMIRNIEVSLVCPEKIGILNGIHVSNSGESK